jgi:hypothetical protein
MSTCIEYDMWEQSKEDIAIFFSSLGTAVTVVSLFAGGPIVAGVGLAVGLSGIAVGFLINTSFPPTEQYECGEAIGLTESDMLGISDHFFSQALAFGVEDLIYSGDDFAIDFKEFVSDNPHIASDEFTEYVIQATNIYSAPPPQTDAELESAVGTIVADAVSLYFHDQLQFL